MYCMVYLMVYVGVCLSRWNDYNKRWLFCCFQLLDGDEDNELAALEKSKPKNDSNGTVIGKILFLSLVRSSFLSSTDNPEHLCPVFFPFTSRLSDFLDFN